MTDQQSPPPAAGRDKLEAQIKSADMTEDMQQDAIDIAQEAMGKYTIEKDIAQHIKRTFDERKGPTWHCIVGRNFGSFVTHETKHFIYFYLGHCAILLFKTQEWLPGKQTPGDYMHFANSANQMVPNKNSNTLVRLGVCIASSPKAPYLGRQAVKKDYLNK